MPRSLACQSQRPRQVSHQYAEANALLAVHHFNRAYLTAYKGIWTTCEHTPFPATCSRQEGRKPPQQYATASRVRPSITNDIDVHDGIHGRRRAARQSVVHIGRPAANHEHNLRGHVSKASNIAQIDYDLPAVKAGARQRDEERHVCEWRGILPGGHGEQWRRPHDAAGRPVGAAFVDAHTAVRGQCRHRGTFKSVVRLDMDVLEILPIPTMWLVVQSGKPSTRSNTIDESDVRPRAISSRRLTTRVPRATTTLPKRQIALPP